MKYGGASIRVGFMLHGWLDSPRWPSAQQSVIFANPLLHSFGDRGNDASYLLFSVGDLGRAMPYVFISLGRAWNFLMSDFRLVAQ